MENQLKKAILGLGAVAAILLTSGAALAASTPDSGVALSFHNLASLRVLDTRLGGSPLGAQQTLDVAIPDLPSDVTSVAVNLTVVDGSQPSFLVAYPTGSERPGTSSINWNDSGATANQTVVQVPASHSITVYNNQGTVNVLIDLLGYYSPSSAGSNAQVSAGPAGPQGPAGATGPQGPAGTITTEGKHWGIIDRNTIGSPVGALRTGPFEGAAVPPLGDGSLGFAVANVAGATEKVSFGNEVDYKGGLVANINKVGFSVFTTGEDKALNVDNLPNITFEVDPTGFTTTTGPNFSSLVFNPAGAGLTTNTFNSIDATSAAAGVWSFTGATGTTVGCNQTTPCTFAQLQTKLAGTFPNMQVLTLAVTKGRDYAWNGAVDALVYNAETINFEPFGVVTTAASS
jgi:hypothetical protein